MIAGRSPSYRFRLSTKGEGARRYVVSGQSPLLRGTVRIVSFAACDGGREDLAFALISRSIIITVPTPAVAVPAIFRLELRAPTTGCVTESAVRKAAP